MTSKKLPMIAAPIACLCLTVAILLGLGDAVVYTLAALSVISIGGLIYLSRTQSGR